MKNILGILLVLVVFPSYAHAADRVRIAVGVGTLQFFGLWLEKKDFFKG